MYNPNFVIKEFMRKELEKVPRHKIVAFAEGRTLFDIEGWMDTLAGKLNGYQLKFKKPYVVTKEPVRRTFIIWTENRGGVIK